MRYWLALLTALLLLVAPSAAQAAPGATIPISLTFSGSTITGTFGGVPVSGTVTGTDAGTFTLLVDGQVFATGSFVCTSGGCTFTVTQLLGADTQFTFTSPTLTSPVRGSISGLFATHGAWVSAVARWANTHLAPTRRGPIVRAAARMRAEAGASAASPADARDQSRGRAREWDHRGGRLR
ncbi:MAG TPA: hypothetical protein VNN19_11485 [bacterium]|nr:hypothetical protein [bacterium]